MTVGGSSSLVTRGAVTWAVGAAATGRLGLFPEEIELPVEDHDQHHHHNGHDRPAQHRSGAGRYPLPRSLSAKFAVGAGKAGR